MTNGYESEQRAEADVEVAGTDVLQVHLQPVAAASWKGALLSAVVGLGGGPLYRFVAAAPDDIRARAEHDVVSAMFPLASFQDLSTAPDDEWTALARKRLDEFDAELVRKGWRRLADRGPHWWSLRYAR